MTTQFDYIKKRAELLIEYKINLDETTASILHILQEEQKKTIQIQHDILYDKVLRVNSEKHILNVDIDNPSKQAFWLGMGQIGFPIIVAIVFFSIFYSYHLYDDNRYEKLGKELSAYKEYYQRSKMPKKPKPPKRN